MIIVNRTPNLRKLPDGKTILQPGANEVSKEVVDLVRKVAHTAQLVKIGKLQILESPKVTDTEINPDEIPHDVSTFPIQSVRKAAAACMDRELLLGWLDTDGRASTRKIVLERVEALKPTDVDEDDEDEQSKE